MPKESEFIEAAGVVDELLPNSQFRVRLDTGKIILAYSAGKMRKHSIRVVKGDRVKVQISSYDLTKGRIVFRES